MSTDPNSARALTSQLIACAQESQRDSAGSADGATATAFHALADELSRWLGAAGCHALLTRALRRARTAHPALQDVELASDPHLRLQRLDDAMEAHGAPALAAGLEAILVATFELLGRLIGDDVSTKLVELSMSHDVPDAAKSESERKLQ